MVISMIKKHSILNSMSHYHKYLVCFVSDGTAITAETLGQSLLSQFPELRYDQRNIPFVTTRRRAEKLLDELQQAKAVYGNHILTFATMPDQKINALLAQAPGHYYEFFNQLVSQLSSDLNLKITPKSGVHHGLTDTKDYDSRMDVVNFALTHDDAISFKHLDQADIILLGVSRSGKTPTCLYLALHYGLRAANYPLTTDDFNLGDLPDKLKAHKNKLIALTITPQRLAEVREKRRSSVLYSSLKVCQHEVKQALQLFEQYQLPILDTTSQSIEELAAKIVQIQSRKHF